MKKRSPQRDRISRHLIALSRDITAADRQAAEKRFKLTKPTISKYVNGIGPNNDLATSLLLFFESCIKVRNRQIEEYANRRKAIQD